VPETPVDHDSDSCSRKDEVGATPNTLENLAIHKITQASSVQYATHLELGSRVARTRPCHPAADRSRGRCESVEAWPAERL
jgi:hypothetical protein